MKYLRSALSVSILVAFCSGAIGGEYGPGVTDKEIKIGQTMPYSGPASAYGTAGLVEQAYYEMTNSKGGIKGRKVNLISLDDGYSPPKTVEQTRKLVEQEEVLAIVGSVGTPTNSATQRYLNLKKVPQIFILSGADKWDNPTKNPYSTALYPPYQMEGRIFAAYLLKNKPNAKLGVFSQNDDSGKDYVKGLKDGLGDHASQMIVKEITYETSDPTVDSQIVALKASGADALYIHATPKFGAQALRKIGELGWKPLSFIASVSNSVKTVLEPAGIDNAKDLLTALAFKSPTDARWQNEEDSKTFLAFMKEWYPRGNSGDVINVIGYISAFMTVKVLELCGDNLTRENLLKQATNLTNISAPLLLPGITINTRPDRYTPYTQMQIARFDGTNWVPEGEVISADNVGR